MKSFETKNHNLEIERIVLSTIINFPKFSYKVERMLNVKIFHLKRHKAILYGLKQLMIDNKPINLVAINYSIESNKFYKESLAPYLDKILEIEPCDFETLESYLQTLLELYTIRKVEKMGHEIVKLTKDLTKIDKVSGILEKYDTILISEEDSIYKPKSVSRIIEDENREAEEAIRKGINREKGISIGFNSLDMIKFRPKNVYCIAGRPAMGKTSLMLKIAFNLVMGGYRIAVYSLEMSEVELMEKLITIYCKISNEDFMKLSEAEQLGYRNKLKRFMEENADNFIIDYYSSEIHEIKNSIYSLHRERKLDTVFIDYLQLIGVKGSSANRNQEITKISRMFKTDIATKLMIPVVELSQLNRSLEKRQNKRPILSDLRESGSIEQDMTMVIFVYRDEVYGIHIDNTGHSTENIAEIIISKNRFGRVGKKKVTFIKKFTLFKDLRKGD